MSAPETMHQSLYTGLVSKVLFPLHERLKHHDTVSVRAAMEDSQWWSPERIRAYQVERLRALLTHAKAKVPYYRDLFASAGFEPGSLDSLEALQSVPFLTKADIRANLDRLKAEGAEGLARFNTGGSSGEPLIFFIGRERVSHDVAAKWRATRWWGVDIGDPEAVVWGSPIELGSQDRIRQIRDRLLRTRLIPAFEMSPEKLDRFVAEIRAMRPRMLFGYPSALAHIARHAKVRDVRMDDLGIRVAFVTSEKLYDDQRRDIESIFGCRVANGYGGRDAGFIAHECPEGGMHITAEDIIVELVDSTGQPVKPGDAGEIIVTHLATAGFPFIRYRTGDVGVLGDQACTCGRGLPLLKDIQGRTTDFVVAQDGTVMHGLALIYVVRDVPGVIRFRIEQESLEKTHVWLETNTKFVAASIETIRTGIRRRLGEGVEVNIDCTDHFPVDTSGKFRYIISRVQTGAIGNPTPLKEVDA